METMASAGSITRYALSEVALDAGLELERAVSGLDWEDAPIHQLAECLATASRWEQSEGAQSFIDATLFDPFDRLVRTQTGEYQTVREIKSFFGHAISDLRGVSHGSGSNTKLPGLMQFCVVLHRELMQEMSLEDAVVERDRETDFIA